MLTSARLRSLKASRELIQELSSTSTPSSSNPTPSNTSNSGAAVVAQNSKLFPPRVPTGKLTFSLEAITRTVNGWNVPGGWVEGMGLVRAVSGQVKLFIFFFVYILSYQIGPVIVLGYFIFNLQVFVWF